MEGLSESGELKGKKFSSLSAPVRREEKVVVQSFVPGLLQPWPAKETRPGELERGSLERVEPSRGWCSRYSRGVALDTCISMRARVKPMTTDARVTSESDISLVSTVAWPSCGKEAFSAFRIRMLLDSFMFLP
jgi:hypothetical protein